MRVVLPEARQHSRVDFAVEIVHDEGAEDRDLMFVRQPIELIFEVHARRHFALAPRRRSPSRPTNGPSGSARPARFRDDIPGQSQEHRGLRHGVAHELRQQLSASTT